MTNSFETFFDEPKFNYDLQKKKFVDNLDFLKSLSVEESTFYKKWKETQGYIDFVNKSDVVKSKIWTPRDILDEKKTIEDIENISPKIIHVDEKGMLADHWLMLRVFVTTHPFDQTPGRFLRLLIRDESSGKYLGFLSISSDVITITVRDKHIGWTEKDRLEDKRLANSAIGSCIVATQPFGYNFLGGKLAACMAVSEEVRKIWKESYKNILVGMTTTSLYGSFSMYDRIPWWKFCGESAGKIAIKPDDDFYETWHHWIQENKQEKYAEKMTQKVGTSGPVTGAKQRSLQMIFSELGLKMSDYIHGFQRGVYYSCMYENTKEFLQGKIEEKDLKPKQNFTDVDMVKWWKEKALRRYQNLKKDNRLKPDLLFYNEMIGMPYKTAKKKYLEEVGR